MRVFVTGATGFIGSAIVQELIGAGHQVVGLARSESSALALTRAGAQAHRGALDDLDSLRRGVEAAEGVIHAAFIHDFSAYVAASETDQRAVEAIGTALAGSGRPFVVTSVTSLLPTRRLVTEDDEPDDKAASAPRIGSEMAALSFATQNVRVSLVRLPASVHGQGDTAFVPALVDIARQQGVSAYVSDGLSRWSAIHRLDAATLYRLALEKGSAGDKFHGVADEGVTIRDIAEVIGKHLNLPIVSIDPEAAQSHFGWLAHFLCNDNPASSAFTRNRLGWQPNQPSLLDDLDAGHYFD